VLFNLAHLLAEHFKYLGLQCANIKSDEVRRGSSRQNCRADSIIATVASDYKAKRSVLRKNGTNASSQQDA
jgi:hypothetical protein